MRRILALGGCGLAVICSPAAAAGPKLMETRSGPFPERSWILSLPEKRDLAPSDVALSENGRAVAALGVVPVDAAKRGSGVVLAIDASESMHDDAIASAMGAARDFASHRLPGSKLGVVFFAREPEVALAPTDDAAAIDRVLATPPPLEPGTRVYDATAAAIDLLRDSGIGVGTVVVLSDGADVGSTTSASELDTLAGRDRTRIFSVGLQSSSFSSDALRDVAEAGGGSYLVANDGKDLAAIYDKLGTQLANEYLVTYRSLAPEATEVAVEASVTGYPRLATAAYTTPALAAGVAGGQAAEGALGPVIAIALIVAAMLGVAAWIALSSPRRSVEDRVGDYGVQSTAAARPDTAQTRAPEDKRRESAQWARFRDEVELSGLGIPAKRIAIVTVAGTALLFWLLAGSGRPAAAVLMLLAPVAVVLAIRARVQLRRRAFADQLADILQVVASAIRAGHSFAGALAVALDEAEEPARSELGRVVRDEALGVPVEAAMASTAHRMKSRELEHAGVVAALQRESGGNTAEVVDHLIDTIRERDELRRLVSTLTAQGRLGGTILTAMPIGLALLLSVLDPGYFDAMLDSSAGQMLLVAGGALICCGWFAIRKIVNVRI